MMKVIKYTAIVLILLFIGVAGYYGYSKLNRNKILDYVNGPSVEPTPTYGSIFSPLVFQKRQMVGYVKDSESVPVGIRPTCPGEYYLDTGTEVVWLTNQDSSMEERVEAYKGYEDSKVQVNGDFKSHEDNECDTEGERYCTCYDKLLVNDITVFEEQ